MNFQPDEMDTGAEKEDLKWHYYLGEAEQEPEVQEQLAEIRKEYAKLDPEDLSFIENCTTSLIRIQAA